MDPLVGRLLDGRYQIESRIARGGMATVYLALDIRLDRTVALKVMHGSLAEDPSFVRRFIGEAKSVASLSHPNVVSVFDQGADRELVYLSMEYVPGKTLRDVLRQRGRLPGREALEIVIPVLAALGAAHQQGMVHRDIKPENVLLSTDGRVKVVDFGLAKAIESSNQTRTGVMIGTIGYMSPEQVTTGAADVRSDVYAVGIMLFELITGQQPYDGETPMSVAYRHVHDTVPPPSAYVPETPQVIDQLVLQATARDPQYRPADATAMLVAAVEAHRSLPRESTPPLSHSQPHQRPPMPGPYGPSGPSGQQTSGYGPAGASGQQTTGYGASGQQTTGYGMGRPTGPADQAPGRTAGTPDQTMVQPAMPAQPAHTTIQPRATGPSGPWESQPEPAPRRGFRMRWFLLVLTLIMATAVGVTGWLVAQPELITVPDLANKHKSVALSEARRLGFKVTIAPGVHDEKVPQDMILSADPPAGTQVQKNSEITLVPSLGAKRIIVPNVVGHTDAAAREKLAEVDLQATSVRLPDPNVPRGTVIKTSPQVGEQVKTGSKVQLVISAGLVMPDVSGMPKDDAIRTLQEQGFQATAAEVADAAEPCTVIAQVPAVGAEVDKGAIAQITVSQCQSTWEDWFTNSGEDVSSDQPMVPVPSVIGKNVKDAEHELKALGFHVKVRKIAKTGVVRIQRPLPGQSRPINSEITLWH